MAGRPSFKPAPKEAAVLSAAQKQDAIARLTKRLKDLERFDPNSAEASSDPQVVALGQAIDRTLVHIFGADTVDYRRYKGVCVLGNAWLDSQIPLVTRRTCLRQDKSKAIAVISGIIKGFQEDLEEFAPSQSSSTINETASTVRPNKVFVVHGHDEGPREALARFLERLEIRPVILHERPNKGRTIITKFREEAADVGFAVVLVTPDDVGGISEAKFKARARQNVVFELGFFIGALGPERVAALVKGDIERPSDFDGVVYISLDNGSWKTDLGRELQAAGYEIDWNKVMKCVN
jgi:predicted nucleotide-binding protein